MKLEEERHITNRERMIRCAKEYWEEIGYPISAYAKFEDGWMKGSILIHENLKEGLTLTRGIFDDGENIYIDDCRGGRLRRITSIPKSQLNY
jgi:hypothetical protein